MDKYTVILLDTKNYSRAMIVVEAELSRQAEAKAMEILDANAERKDEDNNYNVAVTLLGDHSKNLPIEDSNTPVLNMIEDGYWTFGWQEH